MLRSLRFLVVALTLAALTCLMFPPLASAAPAYPTWYLAEGSTAWGFSTDIVIENPNDIAVNCDVSYMTASGLVHGATVHCPPLSSNWIEDLPANKDFSTKVECREGITIAVEREMTPTSPTPDENTYDETSSIGVTAPATTWYLPEGSSAWGFESWLLIQNPNDSAAHCRVTYMIEGLGPQTYDKTIPANSRRSFNMVDDIGAHDASIKVVSLDNPVIPERAMYKNNRRAASESIGTTTPSVDYYLAEGTTDYGFTTYVLVQNPHDTATDVTVTYMTATNTLVQPVFTMPPNSRRTIRVNDAVPAKDLSTKVHGSQTIIAERAMYWDGGGGYGEAMHDSIGMPAPEATFYMPFGRCFIFRGFREVSYTLVMNPNPVPVDITVSYFKPEGTDNVTFTDTLPANSRRTYNMSDKTSVDGVSVSWGTVSTMVTSNTPHRFIMCESSTYHSFGGGFMGGSDSIGGYREGE